MMNPVFPNSGGGGGSDPALEGRVAALESYSKSVTPFTPGGVVGDVELASSQYFDVTISVVVNVYVEGSNGPDNFGVPLTIQSGVTVKKYIDTFNKEYSNFASQLGVDKDYIIASISKEGFLTFSTTPQVTDVQIVGMGAESNIELLGLSNPVFAPAVLLAQKANITDAVDVAVSDDTTVDAVLETLKADVDTLYHVTENDGISNTISFVSSMNLTKTQFLQFYVDGVPFIKKYGKSRAWVDFELVGGGTGGLAWDGVADFAPGGMPGAVRRVSMPLYRFMQLFDESGGSLSFTVGAGVDGRTATTGYMMAGDTSIGNLPNLTTAGAMSDPVNFPPGNGTNAFNAARMMSDAHYPAYEEVNGNPASAVYKNSPDGPAAGGEISSMMEGAGGSSGLSKIANPTEDGASAPSNAFGQFGGGGGAGNIAFPGGNGGFPGGGGGIGNAQNVGSEMKGGDGGDGVIRMRIYMK